jgi:hypothetical protein
MPTSVLGQSTECQNNDWLNTKLECKAGMRLATNISDNNTVEEEGNESYA